MRNRFFKLNFKQNVKQNVALFFIFGIEGVCLIAFPFNPSPGPSTEPSVMWAARGKSGF